MMPLWMALNFAAACAVAALLCWPSLRVAATRKAAHWAAQVWRGLTPGRGAGWGRVAVVSTALLMLTAPVLLVWWTGRQPALPGFDAQIGRGESEVVLALLRGEHLVPPPALPPELFLTQEVQAERPELVGADRRWEQFNPEFRQRLLWVYKVMREQHGYDMVLIEGYRSPERQELLSRQGPHVTLARAWESYHQYGLAADSAFLRDGKIVISERDPWARQGYEIYGQVAVQAGLVWGGRWQNADLAHVELRIGKGRPNAGVNMP